MPVFAYKAANSRAAPEVGTIIADTPRQARDVLRARGLTIAEVELVAPTEKTASVPFRSRLRNQEAVVEFIRELATLQKAGIPLLGALHTLVAQYRGRFRAVVQHLADQVAAGVSLAEAMSRQPAYFDEMCVSIVRVGEHTGGQEAALKRLADFKEKGLRLRSRITGALMYPAVVSVIGIAVALFLMTQVVPNLLDTLTQAGRELPLVTRIVKGASDSIVKWWWALALGVGVAALTIRGILRTEKGRTAADRLWLRVPVLGTLIRKETTARLAVVMAALLRSGVAFSDAIRIARQTVRNRVFAEALSTYEQAVIAGRDVSATLAASGVFSPMVVQMLAVGQEAGQLEDMLDQVAEAYDYQVATAAQRLTAVLEPLLIVFLAILVGFIALATVLPILEASNVL
jgi:general secretion pathway protein F